MTLREKESFVQQFSLRFVKYLDIKIKKSKKICLFKKMGKMKPFVVFTGKMCHHARLCFFLNEETLHPVHTGVRVYL